jgi:type I restriction enzyme R subunit
MAFNENTRVKIPAILHLTQLGYEYVSLKNAAWDSDTNIFTGILKESILRINTGQEIQYEGDTEWPGMAAENATPYGITGISNLLSELKELLDYEDLGRAFYNRLVSSTGIKLIDFDNFDNNSFHVCTELTCKNGEDEFRPDITILINGMPLIFIEVKKPNNTDGILAERNRINVRFQNKKFRRFLNAAQFMIFSNNMEYDNDSVVPIQGAFYAPVKKMKPSLAAFLTLMKM